MRIAILGATGMAGTAITDEAARRGHQVLAVSRHPRQDGVPNVASRAVDAADVGAVIAVLGDVDAVVVAVRPAPGHECTLPALTRNVLDAARTHGARVVVVGGAAPLWSPTLPDRRVLDDPAHIPAAWRSIAQASVDQLTVCREHPHERWTYVSPPANFEPGPRTGKYERGTHTLLVDERGSSRISAADFAIAIVDELENPGEDTHFTVATFGADDKTVENQG
ncbi:NAD(P)-dependent oxidoreductase [uncultured Tessaracoccus sp.]|uniref:NAD(P)-dependent oxidoreductase n=1 Tax=uncultured Tessaracoccus sp. TaxID=905023 RepID=UPI0025EA42E1|nr:NAD(P)H-binding protein [uncultured Tessaracoccus sp.]